MARANQKGRRSSGPPFLQLYRYMLASPAWLSLTPIERAVYVDVAALFNGANNGFIAASVRGIADRVGISPTTTVKSLSKLTDRGFLEVTVQGGFSRKVRHATEWRLTTHRCDRTHAAPSKAFLKWAAPTADHGTISEHSRCQQVVPIRPKAPSTVTAGGTVTRVSA